jgi:hypothetical protein
MNFVVSSTSKSLITSTSLSTLHNSYTDTAYLSNIIHVINLLLLIMLYIKLMQLESYIYNIHGITTSTRIIRKGIMTRIIRNEISTTDIQFLTIY